MSRNQLFEQNEITKIVVKALTEVIRKFDWSHLPELIELQENELKVYQKLLKHIEDGKMDVRLTPRDY